MTDDQQLEPAAEVVDADEVIHRLAVPITKQEANDLEIVRAFQARYNQATEDAVACFQGRRKIVNYPFDEFATEEQILATVRTIARWGAKLALGMQINPDRVKKADLPKED